MSWFFHPLKPESYDFIMIDPMWEFRAWSENGYEKSPEAHYDTMPPEQIAELPVRRLLKKGGVAWVWGTWPLTASGVVPSIINNGWGLSGRTGGAWAKRTRNGLLRWGPGYIIRSTCEPFFLAVNGDIHTKHVFRGRAVANLIETVECGVLDGLAREHSRKPDLAYKIVQSVMPRGSRLADIFSRQPRRGWDRFGHEKDKYHGAE